MQRRGWLAFLPPLVFLPFILSPPVNHDVAAVLAFSQRWLAGEHLYVDLLDVNPPLIFILNLLPAALAGGNGPAGIIALQACVLTLGLLVAWQCRPPAAGACETILLGAFPAFFLLAPGYDFGQREALMALAALPYLFDAANRAAGARPRLAATLIAAIGFALKPHFLAIPLLVEAFVWLRRRRPDATPLILLAVWSAYAALILIAFPVYLDTIIARAMATYVRIAEYSMLSVVTRPRLAAAIAILAVSAIAARRAGGLPAILGLAGIAAAAAAIVQHKGWSYHFVPTELLALALAMLLAARAIDRRRLPRPTLAACGLLSLAMLYMTAAGELPRNQLVYASVVDTPLRAALTRIAPGGRVLVLSSVIAPVHPALNYANATATQPVMDLWPIAGTYRVCTQATPGNPDAPRYRPFVDMLAPEAALFRQIVDGFAAAPPDAILIDRFARIPECPGPFDFLAYFLRSPIFAAIFGQFRKDSTIGQFDFYVRNQPSG